MILGFSATADTWSVNPSDFQFSMTVTGVASMSGDTINQQDAYIGAFVEGQCRGVSPTTLEGGNYKLFLITIYSNNVEGENIEFVLLDEDSVETLIANTIRFKDYADYGSTDNPFLWMDNAQYASTDFFSFALDSQVTSATINATNKTISIMVGRETDKSSLTPTFTLAPEAIAYISDVEQVSEQTTNDYTNTLYYTVKGVDGVDSDWSVEVKYDNSRISEFKNSNFMTYPNPAHHYIVIKNRGWRMKNGQIIDITGKMVKQFKIKNSNTQIQISDLESGIYFIKYENRLVKFIKE